MNIAKGHLLWSCFWSLARTAFILLLVTIIWLLDLPQRNSTPVPLPITDGPFLPLLVPTFLPAPPLAWGTFSLPLLQPMIPFDFPDLMLSSGRTKPPPFTPIHYHQLLSQTLTLLHRGFQAPPPSSTSWALLKCYRLTSSSALP